MQPFDSVSRLEDAAVLDRVVEPVRSAVRRSLRPRPLRNALHGVWLGHALHPVLVQTPVGAFVSAGVLDALPGAAPAADALIATGVASAVPAVAAGLADWSMLHPQQQRVGVVHATANLTGVACYTASLVARRRGQRGRALVLAYAGLGAVSLGGLLGGHLSYRQAAGVNHAEQVPHVVPPGWHDVCAVDDLPSDGTPAVRRLAGVDVVLVRRGAAVRVLSDRCSHLSGPLHEGQVSPDGECITCPWHGSVFRLADGSVVSGPATAPQPSFDVRVTGGRVEARLAGAG